ncbi:CD0519/CD1768 family membrane protein [Dethiothermospora halolimnae]|uniref:CD0519/CD1768 family membrane protein n=1 Tax=Dethiothermospora halolimnae TaxID=3114390 RepID=UPI003CCC145F
MQKSVGVKRKRKTIPHLDTIAFITILVLFFGYVGSQMGVANMFSTIMQTSYKLLLDTVFLIMAVAVLAGAFGKLAMEFGLVNLLNKVFAPLMKPIFNMPGVAFLGIITTYLSDNPAIISLARDDDYISYFKRHEVPCLCNLGTAFGMGLVVTTFMMAQGYLKEALIGNVGAFIGCIVSVRLMARSTKKSLGVEVVKEKTDLSRDELADNLIETNEGSFFERFLSAFLEGGKLGVDIGLSIIPGVLIICTVIMILTFAPPTGGFSGEAYEGVALLPKIGELLSPILQPLFGFENPEAIAFPITALGAVGAALSLVEKFLETGIIGGNEIAVFTAMGMCWSGFLSTHVAMLDSLGHRKLISKAIRSHIVGGLVAGISAHFIVVFSNFIMGFF